MRLSSVDEVMKPLLAGVKPVAPLAWPLERAGGLRLAADLASQSAVPTVNTALRSGLAVNALDLVGVSPHAPIQLLKPPPEVKTGDALPPGYDAILDPAAVTACGPLIEISEPVEPGAHVRLTGHDLSLGQVIAGAGEIITPEVILAARIAGLTHAPVRIAAVLSRLPESPEAFWLSARLRALGLAEAAGDNPVDLVISPASDVRRLALRPSETATAVQAESGAIELAISTRFHDVIGAWCGLALPVIAALQDLELAHRPLVLSRKIASTVGLTEIALLKTDGGLAHPLAVGDLTLSAIASADSFAVVPANSEGIAAGNRVDAVSLDRPFRAKESLP